MHTMRHEESPVTLCDGGDFAFIVGFLVITVGGWDPVHLYGLGNTNANFCLSPHTS